MSEVKQEGDFKIKSKPKKPKNLGVKNEDNKVELKEPFSARSNNNLSEFSISLSSF